MSTSAAEGSKGRYATPRASMLGDIFNPARDPDRQGFWIFIVQRSSVRVGMWRKASGELLLHTRMTSEGITAKELRLDNLEDIDLGIVTPFKLHAFSHITKALLKSRSIGSIYPEYPSLGRAFTCSVRIFDSNL